MHARYFRVFWVSSIQIGCSMRVVYAECIKIFNEALNCQMYYLSHLQKRKKSLFISCMN